MIAANPSQSATRTLAPSSPQNLSLTARYVVRAVTGSFQTRGATRLRVAPPMTIKLNSAPQNDTIKPANKTRKYIARLTSLEVDIRLRPATVNKVGPKAEN